MYFSLRVFIDNYFTTLKQQNTQTISLDYFLRPAYYNATLNIRTYFSLQEFFITESHQSNDAQNQISHFCTVKWSKNRKYGRASILAVLRHVSRVQKCLIWSYAVLKGKVKAIPLQTRCGPVGG